MMNIQRPRSKTSGQGLRSSLAIPFVITVAALAPGCAQETPADEETEEAQLAVTEAQLDEPAPEPETSVSSTSASRVIFNPPPLRPPLNPPRPPLNPPLPPWHRPPFNPPRPPWHHGPPPGNPPAAPWSEDDR